LEKQLLDTYLSFGWFRAGRGLFKKTFLQFSSHFYNAYWLRYDLSSFELTPALKKINQKNSAFKVVVQPLSITDEKKSLYEKYKSSVSFEPSDTLEALLYGSELFDTPIFDTYEVEVYDKEQLIGFGFFDVGEKSAAGINAIYHPEYKKYSLGKYIILQKILYCQSKKMHWFYPGYVAPGYSAFDYKLLFNMQCISYFDFVSNQWITYRNHDSNNAPIQEISEQLLSLIPTLPGIGLIGELVQNPFYDIAMYLPNEQYDLVDVPLYLTLTKPDVPFQFNPIVYWDIFEKCFKCVSYALYHFSKEQVYEASYQNCSLKETNIYFKTNERIELVAFLKYLSKFL
jgi:arginine-tRNA-protein transferase